MTAAGALLLACTLLDAVGQVAMLAGGLLFWLILAGAFRPDRRYRNHHTLDVRFDRD